MHILNYNSSGEESQKIFIKTKDGGILFKNTNNYNNITLNLKQPIVRASEDYVFLISLNHLQIPVSWFIISSYNGNNSIEYIINGITYVYTIPDGNYTAFELLDLFNTNLLLTVTFNTITYKYTFSHSTYNFTITQNTTCYNELGLYNQLYTSTSLSLTSARCIDLTGTQSIYIRTNLTTKNIDSSNALSTSNILDVIPVDVDNFNILRYSNYEGYKVKVLDSVITHIDVIITDDNGKEIDIKNHYSLSIEINQILNQNFASDKIDHSRIISL